MSVWWKDVVGYQIYPSTFNDYNKDGHGDIKGITKKLQYLKDLGIGLIWIGPIYKSPKVDNGYDISDFYSIDESYGNLDDVKIMLKKAKELNIKVIFDLVLNHTSSKHEWFIDACNNIDSIYKDYYIFKDPVDNKPPNNWKGFFQESVWTYVEKINKYYLHIFSKEMPDLNWDNKNLRKEMYKVARFWLDLGVDGFRLDAIAHLSKDKTFKDSKLYKDDLVYDTSKFSNRKEIFKYLKEFKKEVLDHYDCVTIGEVGGCATTDEALKYSSYEDGYFNMVFNFDTCWENGAYGSIDKNDDEIKTNVLNMKKLFEKWYENINGKAWMPIYWLNHDHPRVVSQYGNIEYRNKSAKMLGLTLLFMYGTPFIYQGEEIGMSNVNHDSLDKFTDVNAKNIIKEFEDNYNDYEILRFLNRTSRDNARTLMQWSSKQVNYGKIYLNENYKVVNVEDNLIDEDSILNYYKKIISLRNNEFHNEAVYGKFKLVYRNNKDVFAYKKTSDKTIVVISNFRDYIVTFKDYVSDNKIILHNYNDVMISNNKLVLRPFESYLILIK
ncbi:MAG: alpha-glucosidase [Erysipelotrichaceae bacterium]|nr:alpha-glucosidase [Erysipelotrichaceae bacterium]